jgi:hypothetical protein
MARTSDEIGRTILEPKATEMVNPVPLYNFVTATVSRKHKGRHTCRYRGDAGEGSIPGAVFFAYKTKSDFKPYVKP